MSVQLFQLVEQSVVPLGYELVDVELSGGIIRVFIDWPAQKESRITIEDCEQVSRQLSQVMMVENVDYKRLEVSSPGVDRRLRKPGDFERFVGHRVNVRLRMPFGGRRHWEGELARAEGKSVNDWVLLLSEATPSGKSAKRVSAGAKARQSKKKDQQDGFAQQALKSATEAEITPEHLARPGHGHESPGATTLKDSKGAESAGDLAAMNVLNFNLSEIERAHLVPQLVF